MSEKKEIEVEVNGVVVVGNKRVKFTKQTLRVVRIKTGKELEEEKERRVTNG